MFRCSLVAFIALRVMLCPLFCSGGDENTQAGEIHKAAPCCCAEAEREPCSNSASTPQWPDGCPDGCPGDSSCECTCFCNSLPVRSDAAAAVDPPHFLELPAVDLAGLLAWAEPTPDERRVIAHRLDIDDGRSVRLLLASLLI